MAEQIKISHASTSYGPRSNQVLIADYNPDSFGASVIFRLKNKAARDKLAAIAEAAANNDVVGYSQTTRETFYQEAKKVNFDVSQIKTNCEADCASFAWACAIGACGNKISYSGWSPCTSNFKDYVNQYAAGLFETLTADKYLKSTDYVARGDIVVDEDRHAAVIITNGPKVADSHQISVKISDITTTSVKISIAIVEKKDGEETEESKSANKTAEWISSYTWYYELERLSVTYKKVGPIKLNSLTNVCIKGLVPNNAYRLRISMGSPTDSKESDRSYSQGYIFNTKQDYPGSVQNLNFRMEKIKDSNVLNKLCTISFNAPPTWGDYAQYRKSKGYRTSLLVNGEIVSFSDKLFTFNDKSSSKSLVLKDLLGKYDLKYKDTIQIGVQAWVKDEQGILVFDRETPECSQPIYIKCFLNDVDKMHLKIKNDYKRAILFDPKQEI